MKKETQHIIFNRFKICFRLKKFSTVSASTNKHCNQADDNRLSLLISQKIESINIFGS